jgi:hypothetical protein
VTIEVLLILLVWGGGGLNVYVDKFRVLILQVIRKKVEFGSIENNESITLGYQRQAYEHP